MPDSYAYRHVQTYTAVWVTLLVSAGFGASMILLAEKSSPEGDALIGLLIMAISLGGSLLCLGRLVITVHAKEVRWQFGYVGWPAWQLRMQDISRLEPVRTSRALGSGIRGTAPHRLYNVTMGGPALKLHLRDGRTVTLGTPEPQRLAGFIEPRLRDTPH